MNDLVWYGAITFTASCDVVSEIPDARAGNRRLYERAKNIASRTMVLFHAFANIMSDIMPVNLPSIWYLYWPTIVAAVIIVAVYGYKTMVRERLPKTTHALTS